MNILNHKSKVCAVIPFYNEKDFLKNVISKVLNYVDKIIAINDGSNDGSDLLIQNIENVIILNHSKNFGKGKALSTGFNFAIENDFDFVVTLDGDAQHNPVFIPELIKNLNHFDVVIGNRLNDLKKMPLQRILSNKITSFLLSVKTGQKILDSQCGFRAFKILVLKKIKTKSFGYEAESEMIILAAKNNFKIGFTKISTDYGNEKSKMNPFQAIIGFVKTLFI